MNCRVIMVMFATICATMHSMDGGLTETQKREIKRRMRLTRDYLIAERRRRNAIVLLPTITAVQHWNKIRNEEITRRTNHQIEHQ